MSTTSSRYADWKAPAEDGQMLIWPNASTLLAETRDNSRRLASAVHVLLQGIPLPELRRQAREFVGHTGDAPLFATGHQTELYHPGVWVKNAMINSLARKAGGVAFHFAVDTDAPKHLHLHWPGGSEPITDDDGLTTADWTSLLSPPTPRHLNDIANSLNKTVAAWSFTPSTEPFLASLRRLSLESLNLSTALTNSIHSLEWDLGLRHHALVVSPLWHCEPYLIFLHHFLAKADEVARVYNRVLADYRARHGVRTAARPMPDLNASADEIECPFWLDDVAHGRRMRAILHRHKGHWTISPPKGGEPLVLDSSVDGRVAADRLLKWCRQNQLRIAPRALTLTLFFRLFLADQFVHGIGGGRYDQVTDDFIHGLFDFEPPRFSVTTATLYFPAAVGQRRINLHPLLQEGRRVRHGLLTGEKRTMVTQIDQLPRHSRQRQELFFRMHQRLAAESNSPAIRSWEKKLREAQQASHLHKALFDRDLFFAIQPRERLTAMMDRYDAAF